MAFGLSNGVDFESFKAAVKKMTVLFIDGRGLVAYAEVPLEYYRVAVPDYRIKEVTDGPEQNPTRSQPGKAGAHR